MSLLFIEKKIGPLSVKNRFIFSACEDNLATEKGMVTDAMVSKMEKLAKGGVGLIISGHMAVAVPGRTRKFQTGIYDDSMIPGLKKLADTIKENGAIPVFQLGHAGLQTKKEVTGSVPVGPSLNSGSLDDESINNIITDFIDAARRAVEAGAQGIQLHAAHGYLINQFLSPYYNTRDDDWGIPADGGFRFLEKIISGIQSIMPETMALLVKLNFDDHTPRPGISPELAAGYVQKLSHMGVHGIEASCGTSHLSPWFMCKGNIPVADVLKNVKKDRQLSTEVYLKSIRERCALTEGYNIHLTDKARPVAGESALFAAGGMRSLSTMKEAVESNKTDFISLCRPLIKEPMLINKFMEETSDKALCGSCNRCLVAVSRDIPVYCYDKGLPE